MATTLRFMERPFDLPACARDVVNPHPTAAEIEVGDEVVLYLRDDRNRQDDIFVAVTQRRPEGELLGEISRANRLGARGDARLAKGAALEFHEENVMRYVKASR